MSHEPEGDVRSLIASARQGDVAARDRLFARCRAYLGFVARAQVESWLRAKVDASDLVQQTLLEACRDFARFEGATEKEWLVWLRRILDHNAADFVRRYGKAAKRQVGREVPFRDLGDSGAASGALEPPAPGASPSQEFLRADIELRVAAALTELPPDYQEVIVLRNFERLPFDEVGRRMNRSRPAAQMLWMRAIKRLRAVLEGREVDG
jgi:RNA polymerase sigma-70 factor (ECF subfamily)